MRFPLAWAVAAAIGLTATTGFAADPDPPAAESLPASVPTGETADAPLTAAPTPKSAPASHPTTVAPSATTPPAPPEASDAAGGRRLYRRYCSDCHGRKGNGRGPASYFMSPLPRDFTRGVYKIRSTDTGSLPTDTDLYDVISRGLPGTSMPPWSGLSPADRWRLVGYLKSLSARFREEPPPTPVPLGTRPPTDPGAVARGEKVYREMKCWECHDYDGRGAGPAARTLRDDDGRRIHAFDLAHPWKLKSGASAGRLVRAFLTGLDGTPMPSYRAAMPLADAWDLAAYVRSLFITPPTRSATLVP